MSIEIDYTERVRVPKLSSSQAIIVGKRLVTAAPANLSPRSKKALTKVKREVEELQSARNARVDTVGGTVRPLSGTFNAAWGALHARLEGATKLHAGSHREQANELMALLFRHGLVFLTRNHEERWAESETLLAQLGQPSRAHELERIVGKEYVDAVRLAHHELGKALGIGGVQVVRAKRTRVREPLTKVRDAIADYVRIAAGEVDSEDSATVERFIRLTEPLTAARAANHTSGSAPELPSEAPATTLSATESSVGLIAGAEVA